MQHRAKNTVKLRARYLRMFSKWLKLAARQLAFRAPRQPVSGTRPAPNPAGRFVRAIYTDRSGVRAYKTYVPARDDGRPRPLVVMLHGCKQSADDFAAGTRMNELADEL